MYADSKRRDAGGTTKTAFLTRVDIINMIELSYADWRNRSHHPFQATRSVGSWCDNVLKMDDV
jgi:hypothetical protein